MLKTQRFVVACLVLATGVGIGFLFVMLFTFEVATVPPPAFITTSTSQKQDEVYTALKTALDEKGVSTVGLSPYLLLEHFPGIEEKDFDGVEAIIGHYKIVDNTLTYKSGEAVADAAATDMSAAGFALFLKNFGQRVNLEVSQSTAADVVGQMSEGQEAVAPDTATSSDEFMACTMDAKQCPDGSYVGRSGPDCAFAACPSDTAPKAAIRCTPEQKQAEACIEIYQPVCATVQIQCITTPCEPIQKTYGNSCEACGESSVTEYTAGECKQ